MQFQQVKILYVRNLMLSTTEDTILSSFSKACGHDGGIERVKKLKDYAFVHFRDRDDAIRAMNAMNGKEILPLINNKLNYFNCLFLFACFIQKYLILSTFFTVTDLRDFLI